MLSVISFVKNPVCGAFILFSISLGCFDGTIIRMLTENHSGNVQIHRKGFLDNSSLHRHFRLNEELEQSLREYEDVESWTARIHCAVLIFGEKKSGFARVTGLDPEHEEQVTSLSRKLESGKLFRDSTTQEIMLGAKLRNLLQVEVGEEVVLLARGRTVPSPTIFSQWQVSSKPMRKCAMATGPTCL